MKKIIVFISAMLFITACTEDKTAVVSDTGRKIYSAEYTGVDEVCYDGVVYVRFGGVEENSWGGVKFGSDGKVVTCQLITKVK